MSRKGYPSILLLSAVVLIMASCSRDDGELRNILTITGNVEDSYNNEYSASEAFYIPARLTGCTPVLYRSNLWINLSPESVLRVALFHPSESDEIPEGVFNVTSLYQEGFNGSFTLIIEKAAGGTLLFSSGTVTIIRDGDVYDLNADLIITPESGGGKP